MKYLVTGGAGFIGSWVAEALVKRNHEVLVVDNLSGGDNRVDGTTLSVLDLSCDDLSVIRAFRPEVVFHAAANAREGASQFQPAAVTAANAMASARLLEACIKAGSMKRIVFCSSMARYGEGNQDPPFYETYRPEPIDIYAHNKVCVEGMLKALAKVFGFEWTILVPHNVIGSRQCLRDRFRNVAAITMNRIMRNEPVVIFGDGTQKRAFSAIQDSLPCFLRALDGQAPNLTINVGGSVPISVNELVTAIEEDFNVDVVRRTYYPDRPLEVKNAYCSTELSEKVLGYREDLGWRACIADMAAWAKKIGPLDWYPEQLALDSPVRPTIWK